MVYIVLGILIFGCIIAVLRAYASGNPAGLTTAIRNTAIALAAIGALLVMLRVPLGYAFLGVSAILPFTLRWPVLWQRSGPASAAPQGGASQIETKRLRMVLDHSTGMLDGLVLAGDYRDRRLSQLGLEQLLKIRGDCLADDPDGVQLIEAYIDRVHGPDWRATHSGAHGSDRTASKPSSAIMSREEALEILGLTPTATEAQIREAYHNLIMKLHPDHGGSDYLAAKINQARDVLLGS